MTAESPVLEILEEYKRRFRPELRIPIRDEAGETVAHFAPVQATEEHARLIADWRNMHRESFMTWFRATAERTLA